MAKPKQSATLHEEAVGDETEASLAEETTQGDLTIGSPEEPTLPPLRPSDRELANMAKFLTEDEFKRFVEYRGGRKPAVRLGEHTHWQVLQSVICMVRNAKGELVRGELEAKKLVPLDRIDDKTAEELLGRKLIEPARA